ncbi:MAG: fluoride efflux transporter CrcB [Nitrosomonadaceae bacterium]|mgnify:FL=1|nr:fluoride efflux transporter CrcB [Nitrosomonadaceae bacterium]|tara:strand:- start:82 stop:468 length:387 start_codon:yes stop_codon:yes gene_type:complete
MGVYALIAIGVGAALGAWLRWGFSLILNSIFPTLPFGTLAANLIGCYFIGMAAEYFVYNNTVTAETRLFIITGFLGGLTTFSTFSVETVTLLLREQYSWAFTIISSHVFGSLLMTILGILTIKLFFPN